MGRRKEQRAGKRTAKDAAGPLAIPAWAAGPAVVLIVLAVFLPALRFPFFPFWDDDIHVHANPHIANLSWSSLGALWAGPWQQLYIPLTYTVWAGLAVVSRSMDGWPVSSGPLTPAWFHGANIAAHAVSAWLAFVLLRRVAGKFFPGEPDARVVTAAAIGAIAFACHPLQVEPVAWVSGLRDVLGGCLALAALTVMFGADRPGVGRWSAATALFLASLASKPAGVALPLVAGVLAVSPFAWGWRRTAAVLGPWLLIAAAWVAVTSSAQSAADLARGLVPAWMRPLVAGDALAFYLGKSLWPDGLSADYGRAPQIAREQGWLWWTWLGPAALAAVLAAVKPLRRYLVPLGIFTAALLPTLGLVPFNFQLVSTVADRYAYLALLGPALALAMAMLQADRAWFTAASAAAAAALALLAVQRVPLWSEDVRLFADTLRVNPQSWKAKHNYASALDDRGQTAAAEPLMRDVIARRPDSAEAHNDLAVILWKLDRRAEAVGMMRRSLQLRPTPSSARNLVQMEAQTANADGVIEGLEILLRLEPDNAEAADQLARLRQQRAAP